jgi:EpsI family protein
MRPGVRLAVSAAVLLATLLALHFRSTGEAVPARRALEGVPDSIGRWHSREESPLPAAAADLLKIDDYLMRRYIDETGNSLWLYIGYWASQRRGAAQVHSPRNCLPASGWEPMEASRLTIEVPGGRPPLTVNRYLIQRDRELQVVLYWYHAQGSPVAGEIQAKLRLVRSAILHNRTDGALIRVSSPVSGSTAATTDRLVRYVQALYPSLGAHLPD